MKKVSLLGAHFDSGNMGVGALTMGAITCIRHAWPDAEISLVEYDDAPKSFACRIGGAITTVKLVPLRFSKKFYLPNNIALLLLLSVIVRLLPSRFLQNQIIDRNTSLKHLHSTDTVLSIAGGDSFSDIYGKGRFIYIALPLLWAIAMRKSIVIMPQTIGPFKSFFAARTAAFIMKHSTLVYARDHESLTVARTLMGTSKASRAHFCYDMGFILDPVIPRFPIPKFTAPDHGTKLLLGLNVSGLLCMGGYSGTNTFGLKVDYRELMYSLIEYLIQGRGATVLLIPHVFGSSPESDVTAGDRIYQDLIHQYRETLLPVRGDYDQNEIKYVIGRCNFFIGSRMHACIAALSQCIPAIGIAYSRKFAGVMQAIGAEDLIADPRVHTSPQILEIVGKALDSRDRWTRTLQARMPHVAASVLNILGGGTGGSQTEAASPEGSVKSANSGP